MSKSKRTAQGSQSPAPNQKERLFKGADGRLRTGWLLAVSLFCCATITLAVRWGLLRAFAALFEAWGIDASNAMRAPVWARALFVWHGSLVSAICAAVLLLLSLRLRGLWQCAGGMPRFEGKGLLRGALAGLCGAVVVVLLCLIPDSMRLEWPLTAPRLSPAILPLMAISLLGALAEEAFVKGVLYDGLRVRWGKRWAVAAACVTFFLMSSGYVAGVIGAVNVLLLGLLSCLIYARFGLWTAAGLRWGWSAATMLLLGFGGGEYALYRLYAVSENLMTGGDYGLIYGLWTTLLLAGGVAGMALRGRRKG